MGNLSKVQEYNVLFGSKCFVDVLEFFISNGFHILELVLRIKNEFYRFTFSIYSTYFPYIRRGIAVPVNIVFLK